MKEDAIRFINKNKSEEEVLLSLMQFLLLRCIKVGVAENTKSFSGVTKILRPPGERVIQ